MNAQPHYPALIALYAHTDNGTLVSMIEDNRSRGHLGPCCIEPVTVLAYLGIPRAQLAATLRGLAAAIERVPEFYVFDPADESACALPAAR